MKKFLIVATFVGVMASPAIATGQAYAPSKPIWKIEPKVNLYTAVREGYKIVTFTIRLLRENNRAYQQELYILQKGKNVLLCRNRTDVLETEAIYYCQRLVAPKELK